MRRYRREGFTLIEVLLVVMILAMLAAFVVPNVMRAGDRARIQATQGAIGPAGPIATALKMFKLDVGRYPTSDEGLAALVEKPSTLEDTEAERWGGPYIERADMLKDPWGHEYGYKFPGEVNTESYDLWSNGPDGQEGTDDDIRNWKTDETGG